MSLKCKQWHACCKVTWRGEEPHLLAIELGDGLLRKELVGVGHKGAAARLAVAVAQNVQLQDLADRRKQIVQLLLRRLQRVCNNSNLHISQSPDQPASY